MAFAALDCIPGTKGLTTLGGLAAGMRGLVDSDSSGAVNRGFSPMMMSFLAQLINSTNDAHLYRIVMDGGERFAFLVLDIEGGNIFSSTPEGEPAGDMRLSLDDGSLQPSTVIDGSEVEITHDMSREEFALVSGSIRRTWLQEETPPSKVTKFYG